MGKFYLSIVVDGKLKRIAELPSLVTAVDMIAKWTWFVTPVLDVEVESEGNNGKSSRT